MWCCSDTCGGARLTLHLAKYKIHGCRRWHSLTKTSDGTRPTLDGLLERADGQGRSAGWVRAEQPVEGQSAAAERIRDTLLTRRRLNHGSYEAQLEPYDIALNLTLPFPTRPPEFRDHATDGVLLAVGQDDAKVPLQCHDPLALRLTRLQQRRPAVPVLLDARSDQD